MNPAEMIVAIVFLVIMGRVLQTRYAARHRHDPTPAVTSETDHLRDEVRHLRDRIQVLERVITDTHGSADLDREIERLRDR